MDKLEKQVERWFAKVEMTEEYANDLRSKAKEIVESLRDTTNEERQSLVNQKTAVVAKIQSAEDALLEGTFSKEKYQSITARLEKELEGIETKLVQTSKNYSKGISRVERLVDMAENIKQTYHDAEPEMKREYLDLFFSKFMVKDGKIVAAMPSEYIKPLITSGKLTVRIKNGWLPTSANVPAVLLDKEVMYQVKNQLEMIKDVEANKFVSDDSNMEVVNYEAKRTVRLKNKRQKVHQPATAS